MADLHEGYARALRHTAQLTAAQVKMLFREIVTGKPAKDVEALLATVPDVVDVFGLAAGDLAAAYYDEARAAAGVPRGYLAVPAQPAPLDQVSTSIRWAVAPLFATPPDLSAALDRLVSSSERLALQPGRDTIVHNAIADRIKVGWARTPEPGACGFCLMLASRGAVYASKSTASSVGGRSGFDPSTRRFRDDGTLERQGHGAHIVRRRGNQRIGSSFHDHCRCTPAPVFEDQQVPDINTRLQQVWRDNKRGTDDKARQQALADAFASWT